MCVLPPLPRCSGWASSSLISPNRVSLPRKGRRVGLHIVLFEACSAFTRVAARTLAPSPIRDLLHRRLQPYRCLHDCSGCFRLERLPGGTCTHWKAPPSHGAHPLQTLSMSTASPEKHQTQTKASNVRNVHGFELIVMMGLLKLVVYRFCATRFRRSYCAPDRPRKPVRRTIHEKSNKITSGNSNRQSRHPALCSIEIKIGFLPQIHK